MRSGRSRNDRRSSSASPSGRRSALISDVWEWPPLHRATLEGRRLAFTSIASGQQAPWERVCGRTSISLTAFACPKHPPSLTSVLYSHSKPVQRYVLGPSRVTSCNRASPKCLTCADLFERGTESQFYSDRLAYWIFLIVPARAIATKWLESFKEFPHSTRPASFSTDQVVEFAQQRSNCGARRNGPHRSGPHVARRLRRPGTANHERRIPQAGAVGFDGMASTRSRCTASSRVGAAKMTRVPRSSACHLGFPARIPAPRSQHATQVEGAEEDQRSLRAAR